MMDSYWPLIGIAVVIFGFIIRLNPVLVVLLALLSSGFAAKLSLLELLSSIGALFLKTRNLPLILFLPLAIIGLLERHGLKQQAQQRISQLKHATLGRLLISYLAVREFGAAAGLTSLGGHPQMVRPLLAPMAEAVAELQNPALSDAERQQVRAMAAATDNIGLFFGEDVFVAFGAVILMYTVLKESGVAVDPLHIALWGIPTALAAFVIHSWNLNRFGQKIAKGAKC